MKHGDFYQHFKGGEYFFDRIAIPMEEIMFTSSMTFIGYALDAHTPDGEEVRELELHRTKEGIYVINSDVPHVIYQSEEDYNTEKVWARKVDDFFGMKQVDKYTDVKRFEYKGRN